MVASARLIPCWAWKADGEQLLPVVPFFVNLSVNLSST